MTASEVICKSRRLLLVAFVVAVIGVSTYAFRQEPAYEGRTLTEWLMEATPPNRKESNRERADEAVRRIGTNGLPTIAKLLRARDWPLKSKLNEFFYQRRWYHLRLTTREDRHAYALTACHLLGTIARPLIPEVEAAMTNMNPACRDAAETWLAALRWSDPDTTIESLLATVGSTNLSLSVRWSAAAALEYIAIKEPPSIGGRYSRRELTAWATEAFTALREAEARAASKLR